MSLLVLDRHGIQAKDAAAGGRLGALQSDLYHLLRCLIVPGDTEPRNSDTLRTLTVSTQ